MKTLYIPLILLFIVAWCFFVLAAMDSIPQLTTEIKEEIKELEPLYHLNDKVVVTKGFYQNSIGTLQDCTIRPNKVTYMVILEQRTGEDFLTKDRSIVSIINVDENQIKLLEK